MALKDVVNYVHAVIKEYHEACKFLEPLCRKYFEKHSLSYEHFCSWQFEGDDSIRITYTYENFVWEVEHDSLIVSVEEIVKLMDE